MFQTYVGDVSLIKDKQSVLIDISHGYSIQYRVRFPITSPLPKLVSVVYNNQQICTGQKGKSQNNLLWSVTFKNF